MIKTVVATFRSFNEAERAAQGVKEKGLKTDEISIVTRQGESTDTNGTFKMNTTTIDPTMTGDASTTMDRTRVTESRNDNISDGVVTGGVLGGLAGLLIGAGSMIIPGLGVIAAAGPIAGFLSGAVTGGIVGGLVDLGIPEEHGREYEKEIKQGRVLFSMKTDEKNVSAISSILKQNSALNVETF